MSRPLRIEYPDAWHHVMNRGRRSEKIFLDEEDYRTFLKLLIEAAELWNIRIAAYCFMPNHYHLLIQTPEANLARFMRHINGVYTQRFNKHHHVRAGFVEKLYDYNWSNHKGYQSKGKKWAWLHKDLIFSMLAEDKKKWRRAYRQSRKLFVRFTESTPLNCLFPKEAYSMNREMQQFTLQGNSGRVVLIKFARHFR